MFKITWAEIQQQPCLEQFYFSAWYSSSPDSGQIQIHSVVTWFAFVCSRNTAYTFQIEARSLRYRSTKQCFTWNFLLVLPSSLRPLAQKSRSSPVGWHYQYRCSYSTLFLSMQSTPAAWEPLGSRSEVRNRRQLPFQVMHFYSNALHKVSANGSH